MNLNDIANEEHWVSEANKPAGYTDWFRNQPDDLHDQGCALIVGEQNCWRDSNCWQKVGVMCEFKPSKK